MGVMGQNVKRFAEGNLAYVAEINLNGDYPYFSFDIHASNGKKVILRAHGKTIRKVFNIKKMENGQEYCEIKQKSSFEVMFKLGPKIFKIFPIKGSTT